MTADTELESVVLLRLFEPVRARMIRALLESEDIAVSTVGLEAHSLLPHVGPGIEIVIRVPARDLERARALVSEMEREVEEEPVPSENAPYREAAKKKASPLAPRLKRIAVVASFLCPGGAHFYVQRYPRGALVVVGYLASILAIIADVPLSGFLLALVWTGDVLGGLEGCAVARGEPGGWRRHGPDLALAGICGWSVLSLGPLLGVLAGPDASAWCNYEGRCEGWRGERACMLDAVNRGVALPAPACLACIRRAHECDAVEVDCAHECWPDGGESSGAVGIDDLLVY